MRTADPADLMCEIAIRVLPQNIFTGIHEDVEYSKPSVGDRVFLSNAIPSVLEVHSNVAVGIPASAQILRYEFYHWVHVYFAYNVARIVPDGNQSMETRDTVSDSSGQDTNT